MSIFAGIRDFLGVNSWLPSTSLYPTSEFIPCAVPILLAENYVHHLSPFVPFLQFGENFGIRWYGLSYVAGFIVAWWLLRGLSRKGCCELPEEKTADFITLAAIFGIMLGGRLGYMLFYNFEGFIQRPWIFFQLLDGGMASHGGILGLGIFIWIYARKAGISWVGLADNMVTVCVAGVFFGRIANFINGELYGRKTDVSWAVKFPSELSDHTAFTTGEVATIAENCAKADPALQPMVSQIITEWSPRVRYQLSDLLVEASQKSEAVRDVLAQYLNARHPSQLYEAFLEGLFLLALLMAVRLKWKNAWHGILSGIFFISYAVVRIAVEQVREPDSNHIPLFGIDFTRGQFYSLFMILIGAGFIIYAIKTKRRNQLPASTTG